MLPSCAFHLLKDERIVNGQIQSILHGIAIHTEGAEAIRPIVMLGDDEASCLVPFFGNQAGGLLQALKGGMFVNLSGFGDVQASCLKTSAQYCL